MKMLNVILRESDKITEQILKSLENNADNKQFEIYDAVILGLFEDLIAKVNSLKVLIDNNCYDSLDVISRSAFEAHVYLKYILSQDTQARSAAYAKSAKLSEFRLYDQLTEENKSGKELREYIGLTNEKIKATNLSPSDEDYRNKLTNDYLKLLNTASTKTVWFNSDGRTGNFEQLCNKQGLKNEYELVYRIYSRDVHSLKALSRLKLSDNEVQIGNFNVDPSLNTNMSALFLMGSSRSVMEYYGLKKTLNSFNTMLRINHLIK